MVRLQSVVLFVVSPFLAGLTAQTSFRPRVFDAYAGKLRAVADVDLDGSPDLLRFYGSPGYWQSVTPLLSLGTQAFAPGPTTPLADNTASLVQIADFDGDLRPDLVTSTNQLYAAGIGMLFHRGLPGGAFAPPVHIPLPLLPQAIVLGHANSDGLADLAILSGNAGSWTVRWLLGVSGQAPAAQPPCQMTVPAVYAGLTAFDRDGDGDDDLVTNQTGIQLVLLDTQAGAVAVHGIVSMPNSYGASLFAGDVDGDLDQDLLGVTLGGTTAVVTRFLNQGGVLTPITQTVANPGVVWRAGDLDGDGDLDLAERAPSGLVQIENAAGVFTIRNTVELPTPQQWPSSEAVGFVDVDGDGHLDFVDEAAVWFGDGTFATTTLNDVSELAPVDWEGDGDVDLIRGPAGIWRNDGSGAFTAGGPVWPSAGAGFVFSSEVLVADFDADGRRELLVPRFATNPFPTGFVFQAMHRLEDTGTGQFADLGPVANQRMVFPAFAIDTNADGMLDIVDRSGIWANNGSHQFAVQTQPFGSYEPIAAGDLDGDGDADLLAGMHGTTLGIGIFWQTAPHTLSLQVVSASTDHSLPDRAAVVADLDGDGDLDFAVDRSWASGGFEVWANQGGVFSIAWSISRNGPVAPTRAMVGDIDADGRLDLAFGVADTLVVYRRNGPGFTFDAAAEYYMPSLQFSTLADIDGDGDADVAGPRLQRNRRYQMPAAGRHVQYGTGAVATGGVQPVLGCSGPLRVGSTPVLRLREAVGGTITLLGLGQQPTALQFPGLPGLTYYTYPLDVLLAYVVSGAPGAPGAGTLDVPVSLPPGLQGLQVWLQHFVVDGSAPTWFAHSNGLEFTIGT